MSTDREHLDAETVAAWIDGGLDARSVAAAEAHASNCDRCQALLATLSATMPPEASTGQEAQGVSRLWKWWLAPLAASAAAATLWMVVPQDPMQRPPAPDRQAEMASTPVSPPEPTPAPAASAAIPAEKPSEPAPAIARSEPRARTERTDAETKTEVADAQSNKLAAEAPAQQKQEYAIAAAPPAPPPPPQPLAEAAPPLAAPGVAAQASSGSRAAPLEIVAPDSQIRWRVTGDSIERSQDGGRTWSSVRLNPEEFITEGIAPSPTVCWMVGRQGLVLLAADGINFTPLPFPEPVDLVSIAASDAVRATVVAADGRTFQTTDSGRNWRNP